jgi:hypothetical protein
MNKYTIGTSFMAYSPHGILEEKSCFSFLSFTEEIMLGPISFVDTEAKYCHLKKVTCKGT